MENSNNSATGNLQPGDAFSRRSEGDMRNRNNYNYNCAVNHVNGPCPGYPTPNDPDDTAPFDTAVFIDYLALIDNNRCHATLDDGFLVKTFICPH